MRGNQLRGALAVGPQPQRLSPGVYRGPGGQLANQQGAPLPGQQPQMQVRPLPQGQPQAHIQPYPYRPDKGIPGQVQIQPYRPGMQPPMQGPGGFVRDQVQRQPLQGGWSPRIPAQPGQVYAGGNPNFNEMTGQYNPLGVYQPPQNVDIGHGLQMPIPQQQMGPQIANKPMIMDMPQGNYLQPLVGNNPNFRR